MRLKEPRLKPLPESEWTEEQRAYLEYHRRPSGKIYNIFLTQARYPEMVKHWRPLSGYILDQTNLPARDREMLILRIGWLCRSEYEFGQHARIGMKAGLSAEEIVNITKGPDAPGWAPFDAALLRAADELHADAFITDATWNTLSERYDEKQMVDVIMTVGNYNMVSMFLNSVGVQRDPKLAGFPDPQG